MRPAYGLRALGFPSITNRSERARSVSRNAVFLALSEKGGISEWPIRTESEKRWDDGILDRHPQRGWLERDRKRREEESVVSVLHSKYETLSPREQEVMAYVTSGLLNKQIATKIGISENTVKLHRGHLTEKMGAKSLAELVRMADILGVHGSKA